MGGTGSGPPRTVTSPQSQSFSRGYGSILPTSLAYIVPSTRGCSPWRPDAVMSTTGGMALSVLRIFLGRQGGRRTPRDATAVLFHRDGPYLPSEPTSRGPACGAVVQKKREAPSESPDSLALDFAALPSPTTTSV
ncbi:hypothetical protein GBA52_014974 [Prunus armeniaca]|nr:hypothetical protein GBA52_014974 [Prunus armeniaca]